MKKNLVILLLFAFLCYISSIEILNDNGQKVIRNFCGVNHLKSEMKIGKNSKIKNISSKTRKLSAAYEPIRIFLDTTFLDVQAQTLPNMSKHLPTIKKALKKAVEAMSKLLEVNQFADNIYTDMDSDFFKEQNIGKWDEKLNNQEKMSEDYDYILLARFDVESDGFPTGVLAAAMPILLEETTFRPIIGLMMVSKSPDYFSKENAEHYFSNIFFHELTHGFGFLDSGYEFFPGGRKETLLKKTDQHGITRTYIKTPRVVELAKKYYGCDSLEGVELENQGTGGSALSHWEARLLLGEYMTSEMYQDELAISEFTLALLEDTDWYKVNYYTGGLMRFGKNQGCDFLNEYCLDSSLNSRFKNEFFSLDMKDFSSCTTGRQSRAYNIINLYKNVDQNEYSKLMPTLNNNDGNLYYVGGPFYSADYCPIHYHIEAEYSKSYFVGNCKIGNGNYGSNIYYNNPSTGTTEIHKNSDLPRELGEKYSDNSFCMMSNLVPKGKYEMYGTIFHPMCFPSYCSSSALTILIYDQYIVCPKQGGNVEVEGYSGKLHCPDYNLICTGTVLCNDLFDCIDKKSKYKENTFTYNYTPLTTQRYADLSNVKTIVAGETSDDGVCPKNCVQCTKNKKCKLCIKGYNLIGVKENDDQPIICDKKIDIKNGYYKKNNVYYPFKNSR